jgi:hypothetical protein
MVGIKDMEMPSCCMNCRLLGKEEMYCSIYPRRDIDIITVATNRPNWCPLVEIGTCENCEHYKRIELNSCDEVIATCKKSTDINYHYVSPNFYCKYFEKRGNEE